MRASSQLERGYRRWLRCYPRWFRAAHEDEMIAVLMAGARPGQPRPAAADCADLLAAGLRLRMRPRVPRSERGVLAAIRVMCLGAVAELATAATVAARQHAVLGGPATATVLAGLVAVAFWLWTAWSVGRRWRWAPAVFAAFVAVNLASLARGLARGAPTADAAAGIALCLFEVAAAALLLGMRRVAA